MALMNTTHNPKFKRLYRRLGLGIAQTLGHLECLWQYTHSTANPVYKSADVEPSSEWEGEPGMLLAALLAEGWLDDLGDGLVEVHDYWENCPQTVRDRIKKREQRAGHVRDTSPKKAENSGTCPGHVRDAADKKRKEENRIDTEQKKDPPFTPQGEPASPEQAASKPVRKVPAVDAELEACIAELPALWNASARQHGMIEAEADRTPKIKRLWKESRLFREHWRDIGAIFTANPFNVGALPATAQHPKPHRADIDYALRVASAAKPWIVFEREYENFKRSGPRRKVREGDELL
jgi:hypothetical protein